MIEFDRRTRKVLAAIYNANDGISYEKLLNKFRSQGEQQIPDLSKLIYDFYKEEYISCEDPIKAFAIFEETDCIMGVSKSAVFRTTSKGNRYIQQVNWDLTKWLVPTVISIVALIVSGISFLLQFS